LVPITVVLRRFAAECAPKPSSGAAPGARTAAPSQAGRACHLWDFIQSNLREENLADAAQPLRQALEAGRAIVFFDGLDEVPDDAQKQFVCQAVDDFARSPFAPSHMALTCRTFSYRNQDWVVPDFTAIELAELDDARINQFITAWFEALSEEGVVTAEQARNKSASLWPAIRERGLRELAGNPLQLTNMAVLHRVETLPDNRALLYDRLVRLLLLQWDKVRFDRDRLAVPLHALREEADCREEEFVDGLAWLAWQVHDPRHGGQPGQPADVSELELRGALERLHPSQDQTQGGQSRKADWALRVVAVFRQRGALLREEGRGVFRFPHRSYQEFLAGRHLAQQDDFARKAAGCVDDSRHWWEVVRWAANYMAYVKRSPPNSLGLAAELCAPAAAGETTPLAWRKVYLAGDILAEIGVSQVRRGSELGKSGLAQTRRLLTQLIVQPEEILPAKERALAGITLGKLDDERRGVGLRADGLPDLDFDIKIPAGAFTLGDTGRRVQIEKGYRLAIYPVTVAQYQAFVDAGGYTDRARNWWTRDGWKWKEENEITGPADYDPTFQTPNHPRVGVSWFEAVAFCRWLTEALKAKGGLADMEAITLPGEAQWERAARWNQQTGQVDARPFPWGDSGDDLAQRCNMGGTGIGHTSAVGLFPRGNAACGATDMSGNVWEWCQDLFQKDQPWRVLRGGSWDFDFPGSLRCSFRLYFTPDSRGQRSGFRCVGWLGGSAPRWRHREVGAMPDGRRACPARAKRSPNRPPHAPEVPGKRRGAGRGR
jgi:formylglycine-generating enzyme required for sulfatase activity